MDNNLKLLAVASGALVVLACESPASRNPALEQARFVYQTTRADPQVALRAAVELKQARQTLRAAERVWADGADEASTRTLARLATRQLELARTAGHGLERVDERDEADAANGAEPPLRDTADRAAARAPHGGARSAHASGLSSALSLPAQR